MLTNACPNSLLPVVWNHSIYYLLGGDLFIQINSILFRVHLYFFTRESDFWRNFLESTTQGRTANNPIMLPCNPIPTAEEFACLLWVFYNPRFHLQNIWRKLDHHLWISLLLALWRSEMSLLERAWKDTWWTDARIHLMVWPTQRPQPRW